MKRFFFVVPLLFVLLSCTTPPQRAAKRIEVNVRNTPLGAGSVEAEFDALFSSQLKKQTVELLYYPEDDVVALSFKYQLINYRLFWDAPARARFSAALSLYKKDYEDHSLIDKKSKTRRIYGYFTGLTDWRTVSFSTLSRGYPVVDLGYAFNKSRGTQKSPYFTVTQRQAEDESTTSDSDKRSSLQIGIHFTRSQAEDLAQLFEQTWLDSLRFQTVSPVPEKELDYTEFEGY
jgi:hypothetical protein